MLDLNLKTSSASYGKTEISLMEKGDGYVSVHIVWQWSGLRLEPPPHSGEFSAAVPREELQDLAEMIERARIAPFAPSAWGLDGKSASLTFGVMSLYPVTYAWWGDTPQGWEELHRIAMRVLDLMALIPRQLDLW